MASNEGFIPLAENQHAGVLIVAIAATLSLVACSSLFFYVLVDFISSQRQKDRNGPGPEERPQGKLRFLHTQFGTLFLMLALSDFIQSLGFGFNYHWIVLGGINGGHASCVFQAVAIQVGDTGSALWTLAIAIHTMSVLVFKRTPPKKVMIIAVPGVWLFVAFLAFIGPVAIQTPHDGPFYTPAGDWCWVSTKYDIERLWLHYIWLFITAGFTPILYTIVVISLRRRAANSFGKGVSRQNSTASSRGTDSRFTESESDVEKDEPGFSILPKAPRMSLHDKTALKMTLYPIFYLALALPLSIYRLAGIAGHELPSPMQAAGGALLTLSGIVNICLYIATRNVNRTGTTMSQLERWKGKAFRTVVFTRNVVTESEVDSRSFFGQNSQPVGIMKRPEVRISVRDSKGYHPYEYDGMEKPEAEDPDAYARTDGFPPMPVDRIEIPRSALVRENSMPIRSQYHDTLNMDSEAQVTIPQRPARSPRVNFAGMDPL